MVLVDTSVWISHLRARNKNLEELLLQAEVVCHPFIIGELACGNITNRNEIISLLQSLPMAPIVSQEEFLYFIDSYKLMAIGIGFVDVHLLASCYLLKRPLWTQDKKLHSAAIKLELSYNIKI